MRGSKKTYCLAQEEVEGVPKKGTVLQKSQLPRYRPKQDSLLSNHHHPVDQPTTAKDFNLVQEVAWRGEGGGVTGLKEMEAQLLACKARLLDQDSEIKKLRDEASSNLASIASSLRLLSVSLRKKNTALKQLIKEKDLVIHTQSQ